jgi:hypothetical protein
MESRTVATGLSKRFSILYAGANSRVAHGCILVLKASYITAEDICKR